MMKINFKLLILLFTFSLLTVLADGENELKIGENKFTSETKGFQYFHLNLDLTTPSAYSFTLEFESEYTLAYDFLDCHGRKNYNKKPDMEEGNYCTTYENIENPEFIAFEPKSPIYLSIKFTGKAVIRVTPINVIEMHNSGGYIKKESIKYQNFFYKATNPGYLLAIVSSKADSGINLFHDTEGCKKTLSTYPRLEKHCLWAYHRSYDQLVVPNYDSGRTHYFSIAMDILDSVNFNYEFFAITEVKEGKEVFEFDNSFAKPFKYTAMKGKHTITVNVGNELVNKCEIYLDYAGCRTEHTVLPDSHNNCMLSSKAKTCSLTFDLEEDVDVYFGVETVINERMTVEITTNKSLAFLE
jgi:hypothetical protein